MPEPPLVLQPFDRARLAGEPIAAARSLVGAYLVRTTEPPRGDGGGEPGAERIGRIVEVEAYVGTDDQASHARFGRTTRNRVMWGGAGTAYVYLVYGMYDCLNVVVGPEGTPAAVLVRAVEPVRGLDAMRSARLAHARGRRTRWTPERLRLEEARIDGLDPPRVASGPGAVAAAFSIDRTDTGSDLCSRDAPLRLAAGDDATGARSDRAIAATPRIGIDYADEPWRSVPWRFLDPASRAVSGSRARARTSRPG